MSIPGESNLISPLECIGPSDLASIGDGTLMYPARDSDIVAANANVELLPPSLPPGKAYGSTSLIFDSPWSVQLDSGISSGSLEMEVDGARDFDVSAPDEIQDCSTRTNSLIPSLCSSTLPEETTPEEKQDKRPGRKTHQRTKRKRPDELVESRHERYQEQNRRAAAKCRKKKKAFIEELQQRKESLELVNSSLKKEYNSLLEDVSELKSQLMFHSGCNNDHIDNWMKNEARKFVAKSLNS